MGGKNLPKLSLLFVCYLVVFSTASNDDIDQYDHHRYPPPLARLLPKEGETKQTQTDTTQDPQATGTTETIRQPATVTSLTEAITLAVMTGICGPSLFALIGCGIRQIRLTWDDPFAGGKRPVDEAAERRKLKQQQRESEEDDEEYANNNVRASKVVRNNLDPFNLDREITLDLDKIRAKHPTAKYSNTEKNLAGKLNKGYSKTAEDIL